MGPPSEIASVVAAAADDPAALAVLADWLQQHGDRRGELVALHLVPERSPELAAPIAELAKALDPVPGCRWLSWRSGFVRRAVLTDSQIARLPALLASSASWGLVELIVGEAHLAPVAAILRELAAGLPVLRSLQLRTNLDDRELVDLTEVLPHFPRLERLRIDVVHRSFVPASRLRALSVKIGNAETLPAWAKGTAAALEALWLRSPAQVFAAPWLTPDRLPGLRRLGVVSPQRWHVATTGFALDRHETVVAPRGRAETWQIVDRRAESISDQPVALIALAGDGVEAGTLHPITRAPFSIGRGVDGAVVDLPIDSPYLALRHAQILWHDGWFVADAGSTNGTRLENVFLGAQPVPLRDGAEVQVGYSLFRFLQGDIAERAAATRRELGVE